MSLPNVNYSPAVHAALMTKRDKLSASLDAITTLAMQQKRSLLASEARSFEKLALKIKKIDREIKAHTAAGDRLSRANAAAAENERGRYNVGSESRTYRPDARDDQGEQFGYVRDFVARALHRDVDAAARIQRHERESVDILRANPELATELRINPNTTAGTGGEFVPPAWLIKDYVAVLRAGRATADLCRKYPMPPGTDVIDIPKISTGASVQPQTANAAPVASVDIVTTVVAAPVVTLAGQQDISIQLLEQSPVALDGVVFMDLTADLNRTLDKQVISGTGTGGQLTGLTTLAGINTVTYTDGSPTLPALWPKIAQAIPQITATRFLPPDAIVMAPRRWLWAASQLDSQNRTLVVPAANAVNEVALAADNLEEGKPVGTILGIPVYIDQNLPLTGGAGNNQDTILVARFDDAWLYESVLKLRLLPEILSGTLQVRMQAYEYAAMAPRLAQSITTITGTGLVAPAGWS